MAPTAADVTDPGPSPVALWIGTAAVAVVAFGVLALALVPAERGDVTTASATTVVIMDSRALVAPRLTIAAPDGPEARAVALTPLHQTPRHVASVSTPSDAAHAASTLPEPNDPVIVLTDEMIYRLPWQALARLELPDGALVIDVFGGRLGHVEDGEIVAADPGLADPD